MKRSHIWAVAALLAAGTIVGGPPNVSAATEPGLEPLYAVAVTEDGIAFRVATGGCTRVEDFRADVRHEGGAAHMALMRTKPDHCKGFFPEGAEMFLPRLAIGLERSAPVVIENPLVDPPVGPRR